jgi:hypothetical protein
MKRFSLPSLLAVVVVVLFAVACSDSTTAPANSHALVAPTGTATDLGKPPPPPVKVVIEVSVQSPGHAVFTGVYFSNGEITEDGGGTIPTFDGTAWLRLDNKQPDVVGFASASVSANARFMARDMNFSGSGTLFIEGHAYRITAVDVFIPQSDCGAAETGFVPCAIISFRARDENNVEHTGQAAAFDQANCLVPNSGSGGGFFFVCGDE